MAARTFGGMAGVRCLSELGQLDQGGTGGCEGERRTGDQQLRWETYGPRCAICGAIEDVGVL